MIVSIFLILSIIIGLVIYIVYSFRMPIILIFLVLIIMIAIKLIKEYQLYGSCSITKIFKKRSDENQRLNLIELILKQNNVQIIAKQQFIDLIGISKNYVYLICMIDDTGQITKNLDESYLIVKNESTYLNPNYFQLLKEIEKNFQLADFKIKKIIIKKETCMIMFPYEKDYQVITIEHLHQYLQKLERNSYHTNQEIEQTKKKIQETLSKCVKFKENACIQEQTKLQSK